MISEVPKSHRIHIERKPNETITNLEAFKLGFDRILLKTVYEKKTEKIFSKLIEIKNGDAKILFEENRKKRLLKATELKSIAEALLACKTGGITELKSISYSFKITSKTSKLIESIIEEEYRKAFLHYEPMTFEEGKEILEGNLCEDVAAFIDNYWHEWANEAGLSQEEIAIGHNYEIDDNLIEYFIENQELAKEITPEQIKNKIKSIEKDIKENTSKGAPKKNLKLHCAVLVFKESGLCKGCATDFRIMYECFDYMGLIDEKLKKGWDKNKSNQSEIQFIKSVYKEAKKYKFKFYDIR